MNQMNGTGPLGSDPLNTAWGMFALTGNPGFYLLYNGIHTPDADAEDPERR